MLNADQRKTGNPAGQLYRMLQALYLAEKISEEDIGHVRQDWPNPAQAGRAVDGKLIGRHLNGCMPLFKESIVKLSHVFLNA